MANTDRITAGAFKAYMRQESLRVSPTLAGTNSMAWCDGWDNAVIAAVRILKLEARLEIPDEPPLEIVSEDEESDESASDGAGEKAPPDEPQARHNPKRLRTLLYGTKCRYDSHRD